MSDQDLPVSDTIRRRVDAYTGPDHYRFTIDGIEYDAHWAHDTRRLLDENARLNAELDEWRRVGAQANQGLKDAAAELEARNDEITRMGKEIVKANEGFAAIWAEINTWDLTDEQIDERLENIGGVPRVEGWIKLAVKRGNAKALKAILEPAPEMPRPPAVEALEAAEPSGTGSGRGTGVAEGEVSRQAIDWPNVDGWTLSGRPGGILLSHDTDADRPLLLSDEGLPLGAVLTFIETQPEDVEEAEPDLSLIPADLITSDPGIRGGEPCITGTRVPAHEVAGYLGDGATWDEVREMLPSLPSLPVPSTEDSDEH